MTEGQNAMGIPEGYLRDGQGRLVPRDSIKPEHLLEDGLVRRLAQSALETSETLLKFRRHARGEVQAYLDILAQEYGTQKGGTRGNVTLTSYDGRLRVQLAVGDTLTFGPELQVAKSLIDECLRSWTDGARTELRTLIEDVFQVGKAGRLDVDRILSLRKLDIVDERWARAMEAISNAVRVHSSKEYMRFYTRPNAEGDFTQIPLDLARV